MAVGGKNFPWVGSSMRIWGKSFFQWRPKLGRRGPDFTPQQHLSSLKLLQFYFSLKKVNSCRWRQDFYAKIMKKLYKSTGYSQDFLQTLYFKALRLDSNQAPHSSHTSTIFIPHNKILEKNEFGQPFFRKNLCLLYVKPVTLTVKRQHDFHFRPWACRKIKQ